MNRVDGIRTTAVVALLAMAAPAALAQTSPLFTGENADLWLIDGEDGRISGYDFGMWLEQFAPGSTPIYPLDANQQAIINNLQLSSVPMSPNQPVISLAGLDGGGDGDNPEGHPPLVVVPGDGTYNNTIAVQMRVDTGLMALDRPTLEWSVNGGPTTSMLLSKDLLQQPGAVVLGGYYVTVFHLARDGSYTVSIRLTEPSAAPPATRTLATESRNYTLAATDGEMRDTDGDGIPDVIEAEIGLDPYRDDWLEDADGDGWSEFDAWLRAPCLDPATRLVLPGSDCHDGDGKPIDTDGDGWADFDEIVRGTNHDDVQPEPLVLLEDDETETSESLLARIQRYKDFPAARRLYEVEVILDGSIAGAATEPLPPQRVEAVTILGDKTYSTDDLLTAEDILRARLDAGDVAARLLASNAAAAIAAGQTPAIRMPAGDSGVLLVEHRSATPPDDYTRVYKRWTPKLPDLSPAGFYAQPGQPVYASAAEWRNAFVAYLASGLAVQDSGFAVDVDSTRVATLVEAALSHEWRLRGLGKMQLFATAPGAIDGDFVRQFRVSLGRFGGEDYTIDQLANQLNAIVSPGGALAAVADWLDARFLTVAAGVRSDAFIQARLERSYDDGCYIESSVVAELQANPPAWAEFLERCPNYVTETELPDILIADQERLHRLRTAALPGAELPINADATLLQPGANSDADSWLNLLEIRRPMDSVTLPWVTDTDGDGIADGADPCGADPFNNCSDNPVLPGLTIGANVFVSEPLNGSGVVIITVILDRASDEPVTVDFRAFVNTGDTASGGTDFIEITGSITIAPGERVGIITVPILADALTEGPETFSVEITGTTGAVVTDGAITVVTINDPTVSNTPPQFTSAESVDVVEGSTVTGYTATATDTDGDTLVFGISGGADQAAFDIDPATGVLSFVAAPSFDSPGDADADNVYNVQLQVDDGNGGSDQLDVAVTVRSATPGSIYLTMTYPTPNANLGGGLTQTLVRGRLFDPSDGIVDAAEVNYIDINGQLATLDAADPSYWSVQVPVSVGDNTLAIELDLADGTNTVSNVQLANFDVHTFFVKSDFDAAANRVLVADSGSDIVISVDVATGERTVVSGDGTGGGPNFNSPRDVALDAANNRVLVPNWQLDALFSADLATGDRTIVANNSTGAGPTIDGPHAVALDSASNRAFVFASQSSAIFEVNLATGDRTVLSDAVTGTGPAFQSEQDVVLDAANNRLLALDGSLDAVVAVDLVTGDRTIVSDAATGTGAEFSSPLAGAVDTANNRILVASLSRGLFSIDLATGDRTLVHDPGTDYGANGSDLRGLAFDAANGRVYLSDSTVDAIFAVDLATGVRSVASDSQTGSGGPETGLWSTQGISLDLNANRVLTSNNQTDVVLAVDLGSGDRTIVSGANTGAGVPLQNPHQMVVDATNNRAFLADSSRREIIVVDLATGDRTTISGGSVGAGPTFVLLNDVRLDLPNGRLFAFDLSAGLFEVAIGSGDRTIVSSDATGSGPSFSGSNYLAIDPAGNRAWLPNFSLDAIIEVNLATGDRTIISDNVSLGTGVAFNVPFDIVYDEDENRLIVTDYGVDGLIAVDLATGNRSLISSNSVGAGVPFRSPYYLTLDAENRRLFLYELGNTAIVVVDLATGDRAVTSKQ